MVTLRAEKTKTKGYSLYLDIYKNGKRKKKRLGLYVSKDYTKGGRVKQDDKFYWDLANKMRTEHQHKLDLDGTSFINDLSDNTSFVEYASKKSENKNNPSYTYAIRKLIEFKGEKITFGHIDINFLNNFKTHLLDSGISSNTAKTYLTRIKIIWNEAIKEKITTKTPFLNFTMPKKINKPKTFLSIEEIQILANYDPENESFIKVKKAFIFSCFTGLRVSDVTALKWSNIVDDGNFIEFRQRKSKTNILRIPLHPTVKAILNSIGEKKDTIFGLSTRSYTNKVLKDIGENALSKHLHSHVARHTFGSLIVTYGGDLYSAKLLLGHSTNDVTAVYAHLTDKRKIEIVNKIPVIKTFDKK